MGFAVFGVGCVAQRGGTATGDGKLSTDRAGQVGVDDDGMAAGGLADGPEDGAVVDAGDLDLAADEAADPLADAEAGRAVLSEQTGAVGVVHLWPSGVRFIS